MAASHVVTKQAIPCGRTGVETHSFITLASLNVVKTARPPAAAVQHVVRRVKSTWR